MFLQFPSDLFLPLPWTLAPQGLRKAHASSSPGHAPLGPSHCQPCTRPVAVCTPWVTGMYPYERPLLPLAPRAVPASNSVLGGPVTLAPLGGALPSSSYCAHPSASPGLDPGGLQWDQEQGPRGWSDTPIQSFSPGVHGTQGDSEQRGHPRGPCALRLCSRMECEFSPAPQRPGHRSCYRCCFRTHLSAQLQVATDQLPLGLPWALWTPPRPALVTSTSQLLGAPPLFAFAGLSVEWTSGPGSWLFLCSFLGDEGWGGGFGGNPGAWGPRRGLTSHLASRGPQLPTLLRPTERVAD